VTLTGAELADGLLADRYRLLERIAVGGMGEVWRADDVVLSRQVAVKTLRSEYSSERDRARFRAEARHAARLAHPGIASVYDFGESHDRAWLVMELIDGEPLSHLLHREAPLPVERTLDIVSQTAVALHAAHLGGVVHRDVKPGNLLLRPDGVLKVTDFGIASAADAPSLTQTGLVVGTAYYLSPEQAAGRSGSPASDLYSLGVVAYECLTGNRPFRGDSAVSVALAHLHETAPDLPESVPPAVRDLVMRALAKRPEDRFPDAAAMAATAAALRSGTAGVPPAGSSRHEPVGTPQGLPATERVPVPDRHGGSARLPGSGRRSARAAVSSTLVLLVALAGGAGVRALLTDEGSSTSGTTTAPAADSRTVALDGYAGRAGEEVRAELAGLGLLPRLAYDGVGYPVGTVSAVDPGGDVEVGSEVVVHVVPPPEATPGPVVEPGTATSDSAAPDAGQPAPAAPAAPAVEAPPPAGPAPADGSTDADAPAAPAGKGNGNGKAAEPGADKGTDKAADKAGKAGEQQGGGKGRSDG
jgi:serine/threonine-protein kinase